MHQDQIKFVQSEIKVENMAKLLYYHGLSQPFTIQFLQSISEVKSSSCSTLDLFEQSK